MRTEEQQSAVRALKKALDQCHAAGLTGGVYEYRMRLWPVDSPQDPAESGGRFFEVVEQYGFTVDSPIVLDGGVGV